MAAKDPQVLPSSDEQYPKPNPEKQRELLVFLNQNVLKLAPSPLPPPPNSFAIHMQDSITVALFSLPFLFSLYPLSDKQESLTMTTISIHRTEFLSFSSNGFRTSRKCQRFTLSPTMKMDRKSVETVKKEDLSIQLKKPSIPQLENSRPSDLRFDRQQPLDEELNQQKRLEFGNFVAREAYLDEEFWTAAWLRAESHWEDRPTERYVDNFKRKFAEQEFTAIKGRYKGQQRQTYTCLVAVKKDERNVKRTVLKSVVGTLDISIRHLLDGESFPGEREKHLFCSIKRTHLNKYVYVSNLCVAKSARRLGVARNMLQFVIESAKLSGIELVYVHVHRNNGPALELYKKIGFKMVEMASPQLVKQDMYLLCLKA
ncbi:hypothetical protein PTKIN_Ptkin19aG0086900 [Pterospermum kingtungense]